MKIVSFNFKGQDHLGIIMGEAVVNLSGALQTYKLIVEDKLGPGISSIIELMNLDLFEPELFQQVLKFLEEHKLTDNFLIRDGYKLNPPIKRPGKIIALGRNYLGHAKESGYGVPEEPIIFCKASSSVIGPEEPIVYKKYLSRVDPEAELAVVIGKVCRDVTEAESPNYIAGYSIMNDVTARDMQSEDIAQHNPWFRSKSLDTFCPFGPCIVTADELKEPVELDIELRVNGEVRQKDNTRSLLFKVPKLIEFISHLMTLEPGDVISTGTPEGIKPIFPGDVVEVTIEKIGTLRNPVVGE